MATKFALGVVVLAFMAWTTTLLSGPDQAFGGAPDAGLAGLAVGSDGTAWFSRDLGPTLGSVSPAGVLTEVALPRRGIQVYAHGPLPLAVGGGGSVWMQTEGGIVHRDASGALTLLPLDAERPFPSAPFSGGRAMSSIAVGPDGALWGTEWSDGGVMRVTQDGTSTRFTTPYVKASDIMLGSDGRLWFLGVREGGFVRLVAITTDGAVGDISSDLPAGSPGMATAVGRGRGTESPHIGGMVLGADGNAWLSETSRGIVYRITSSGVVSEFPVHVGDGGSIAASGDGGIWLSGGDVPDTVIRLTPDGRTVAWPLPAGAHAGHLTGDHDGSVWFLASNINRIGRTTPAGSTQLFGEGLSVHPVLKILRGRQSAGGRLVLSVRACAPLGRVTFVGGQRLYRTQGGRYTQERRIVLLRQQTRVCQQHRLAWRRPSRTGWQYVLDIAIRASDGELSSYEQYQAHRGRER